MYSTCEPSRQNLYTVYTCVLSLTSIQASSQCCLHFILCLLLTLPLLVEDQESPPLPQDTGQLNSSSSQQPQAPPSSSTAPTTNTSQYQYNYSQQYGYQYQYPYNGQWTWQAPVAAWGGWQPQQYQQQQQPASTSSYQHGYGQQSNQEQERKVSQGTGWSKVNKDGSGEQRWKPVQGSAQDREDSWHQSGSVGGAMGGVNHSVGSWQTQRTQPGTQGGNDWQRGGGDRGYDQQQTGQWQSSERQPQNPPSQAWAGDRSQRPAFGVGRGSVQPQHTPQEAQSHDGGPKMSFSWLGRGRGVGRGRGRGAGRWDSKVAGNLPSYYMYMNMSLGMFS